MRRIGVLLCSVALLACAGLTGAAFVLGDAGGGSGEEAARVAAETSSPGGGAVAVPECTLERRLVMAADHRPARGVAVELAGKDDKAVTDDTGRFSFAVPGHDAVTVRVETRVDLIDTTERGRGEHVLLPARVVEVTYDVTESCASHAAEVREVIHDEGFNPRPAPPPLPLPGGLRLSPPAVVAPRVTPLPGNGANVPWTGYFWASAPVITAAVCDVDDGDTRAAAEQALRWLVGSRALGWEIVRNDSACSPDAPRPKLIITRRDEGDDELLGDAWAEDVDGAECDPDGSGQPCWVGTAYAVANPAGFDPLTPGEKLATLLHEIGHAFGLGHAYACADTVMWYDDSCDRSPTSRLGDDDVASLNELLAATLAALGR